MNIHVARTPHFRTRFTHTCCQGQTGSLTVRPDTARWCFGDPCWYNAGPPSPDAGPASHQRLCERSAMLPVLWPVANYYWPSVLQIGPQRWFNAGPTLLVRIMNKTLTQHWVNAYNSFHLYINMLFFRLTSHINPAVKQTPSWLQQTNQNVTTAVHSFDIFQLCS